MKVISLIQPWATLITLGEKEFETRTWKTKYRGQLMIHASKKIDLTVCEIPSIAKTLKKHGIMNYKDLPTGKILAICTLVDCLQVTANNGDSAILNNGSWIVSGNEYDFGYYDEGRYAWKLSGVRTLNTSIPVKGHLGLWTYEQVRSEHLILSN